MQSQLWITKTRITEKKKREIRSQEKKEKIIRRRIIKDTNPSERKNYCKKKPAARAVPKLDRTNHNIAIQKFSSNAEIFPNYSYFKIIMIRFHKAGGFSEIPILKGKYVTLVNMLFSRISLLDYDSVIDWLLIWVVPRCCYIMTWTGCRIPTESRNNNIFIPPDGWDMS